MRTLYTAPSAELPKLSTDALFTDPATVYRFRGPIDEATRFVEREQLLRPDTWARFVRQFSFNADAFADGWTALGWRCEYWGKMMRGACFTYAYTKNPELYATLTDTVRDMLRVHTTCGRLSTYAPERAYDGWDMWGRKYVLLGMEYFYEICTDEALKADILCSLCRQADDILSAVGPAEEGKKPINTTTRHWRGLNSSSILEPMVRLYSLTGETRYFDFAAYIVREGGTQVFDIFKEARRNKLNPYQYPMTKAYEMISCFEGLLEFYRVTGKEEYRESVVRFADRMLKTDFTIIGCAGCTHELFDHSTVRQANTNNGEIQQETCVTVTIMKFLYQLTCLTGDVKYVDAFETALYNAYLGSVNTERCIEGGLEAYFRSPEQVHEATELFPEPLPFDSYSPLTAGIRGNGIGGLKFMSDGHYYGCCACIGSAGFGLVPKMTLLTAENMLSLNLYFDGDILTKTPDGQPLTLSISTAYPVGGEVSVTLRLATPEAFRLRLRIPSFSRTARVCICGEERSVPSGYLDVERTFSDGDTLTLSFDMTTRALRPIPYGHQILMNDVNWNYQYVTPTYDEEDPLAKHHVALVRGPLVLAQETRLGSDPDTPVSIVIGEDGAVNATVPTVPKAPYPCLVELAVPLTNGTVMHLTDYASAGKLFSNESRMAAWILTE